jgi:hypothetical protein
MVDALELLLKVMSDDWRTPGKSEFGHSLRKMYFEVFNCNHPNPTLLPLLEKAILDQKFIFEPAGSLLDHVEGIENLWDELTTEFYRRDWMKHHHLHKEVTAPVSFSTYLMNNFHRFFKHESWTYEFRSKEERIQMLEMEIQWRQERIEQLRNSTETLGEENERKARDGLAKAEEALARFPLNFQMNLENRGGVLSFGKWEGSVVMPGMLDRD